MTTHREDRALFRRIIERSQLPIAVFSEWVMGVDRTTGQRYLHDGEIPRSKRIWLRHIKNVIHRGNEVHVTLEWQPPNPRWWPYVERQPHTFMAEERGLKTRDYQRRGR
jgi:hypothetical protein